MVILHVTYSFEVENKQGEFVIFNFLVNCLFYYKKTSDARETGHYCISLFGLRCNFDVSSREWVRHHGCMAVRLASQHDDDVYAFGHAYQIYVKLISSATSPVANMTHLVF